jgi:hypothetical protein
MAAAEETILLNFEIDQTQAQKQLVTTEKNILSLKRQQSELNKEYKAGKVSEDEYVNANLRMQKAIGRETEQKKILNKLLNVEVNSRGAMRARVAELNKEFDKLNPNTEKGQKRSKELTAELKKLNEELNKGSKEAGQFKDNIGNYPEQLAAATNSVKPFGISVGDASASLSKFATPATAAVGILAALGTAYASSSAGAKDLAFAQDRLSFVTSSVIEAFGTLVGGTGEGGEGILSKGLDLMIDFAKAIPGVNVALLGFELATGKTINSINEQSKAFAAAREELRKLEIEGVRAQGFAKLFENAAENARRVRDDEEALLEFRLKSADAVEQNLLANQTVRLNVLNQEIEAIKKANVNWQNQDAIVLQIEQKRAQTRDIEEEINGKLTENFTARKKLISEIAALERANRRAANQDVDTTVADPLQGAFDTRLKVTEDLNDRIVKANKEADLEIQRNRQRSAEAQIEIEKNLGETRLNVIDGVLGAASSLFNQESEEYKAFATFQTLISTYSAAQKAYEAAFVPPTIASPALGAANVALAIATGLANLAAIHGVQFAEGGWTGPGDKHKPVGVVHADEYVTPKHIVNSPAARPHISALENMRVRGFADGGFVTSQNIAASQNALIIANTLKNQPRPVVSWTEGRAVGRRVEQREKVGRL